MKTFIIIVTILIVCLLIKILGLLHKSQQRRNYLFIIREELDDLTKRFETNKEFFHPSEQREIYIELANLRQTTKESVEWNYYVFTRLKYKISDRELDIQKIKNFEKLLDKYKLLEIGLTDDRKKTIEVYVQDLKRMLAYKPFSSSIREISMALDFLSATLKHYENKSPIFDFQLQGEYDRLRTWVRTRYY